MPFDPAAPVLWRLAPSPADALEGGTAGLTTALLDDLIGTPLLKNFLRRRRRDPAEAAACEMILAMQQTLGPGACIGQALVRTHAKGPPRILAIDARAEIGETGLLSPAVFSGGVSLPVKIRYREEALALLRISHKRGFIVATNPGTFEERACLRSLGGEPIGKADLPAAMRKRPANALFPRSVKLYRFGE